MATDHQIGVRFPYAQPISIGDSYSGITLVSKTNDWCSIRQSPAISTWASSQYWHRVQSAKLRQWWVRFPPRSPISQWLCGVKVVSPPSQGGDAGALPARAANFNGSIVYRLGQWIFNPLRAVRLRLELPTSYRSNAQTASLLKMTSPLDSG